MELDEFRINILEEFRSDASHNEVSPEEEFINYSLETLESLGLFPSPYPIACNIRGSRGRKICFDAYGYDEADSSIILFISDFQNSLDSTTLTNTRINELYQQMALFIEEAYNNNIKNYCDDSDPIIDVAKDFRRRIGKGKLDTEIEKFKFFIVTNSIISSKVKTISRPDLLDRPSELNIWDIEHFFQADQSTNSEAITIMCKDFGCDGIQYLKANIGGTSEYDAYLAIVPGLFLANIYKQFGSRLLQGNIRAFLSNRGKVNKKIRETIIKEPSRFFSYNNGIAVVAQSITLSPNRERIVSFRDFQIINGGQTTASLASALIKKKTTAQNMQNIFVPMKLTVLNIFSEQATEEDIEKYNELTQKISRSANSQNSVSDADFFSNHPFHVRMEELSKTGKCMAPPVDGHPYSTIWYYERSRGKWEQEQMQLTQAGRDKFKEKHPKRQVIKKEKLAKCLNTIYMNPHVVCTGAARNMKAFAEQIDELYNASKDNINDFFFRRCVCAVILFDTTDRIVNHADWYPTGGNKAQIVPYTIAKIIASIPKGKEIDWTLIWNKQSLYASLVAQIESVAFIAHKFLLESQGKIVREYAVKQDTWRRFRDDVEIVLSDDFVNSLISTSQSKDEAKASKREHKFNSSLSLALDFFKLGYQYWLTVYKGLEEEGILSTADRDFVKSIAGYIKATKLPTEKQSKRLLSIITKAEDEGFIMP